MKKITLLILFTFLLILPASAQGWYNVPSGTPVIFYSVSFSKSNINYGFVCGENGTILGTYDKGESWWTANTNLQYWLSGISTVDENTAYAVGFNAQSYWATILRTTNGGITWDELWGNVPSGYSLNSVSFSDRFHGTAVGRFGTVIRTNDGGNNWFPQTATEYDMLGVCFVNNNTGWIAGALGTIKKTTNGGTNWLNQTSPDTNKINGISFYNELYGTVAGVDGFIATTSDGGFNWTRRMSYVAYSLNAVSQTSRYNITVTGNNGTILRSNDGGESWYRQTGPNPGITYYGVHFINALTGISVGGAGKIIKTTNAGGDSGNVINVRQINSAIPSRYELFQNYPNPFNPSTRIKFSILEVGYVTLKIFDINGREISNLVNQKMNSGTYDVYLDASRFSSGVYFYTLAINNIRITNKMVLVR